MYQKFVYLSLFHLLTINLLWEQSWVYNIKKTPYVSCLFVPGSEDILFQSLLLESLNFYLNLKVLHPEMICLKKNLHFHSLQKRSQNNSIVLIYTHNFGLNKVHKSLSRIYNSRLLMNTWVLLHLEKLPTSERIPLITILSELLNWLLNGVCLTNWSTVSKREFSMHGCGHMTLCIFDDTV